MTGPETPDGFTEWDSDGNDVTDRSNPVADPEIGRVPDHTATAEGESAAPPTETPSRPRRPWDAITAPRSTGKRSAPRMAPTTKTRGKADASTSSSGESVPNLPRGFEAQLRDMYVTLGTMILPFDGVCGNAIVQAAPKCASSLVEYAKNNADVRRVLLRLVGTSALGILIAAHTPIIMAIAAHHIAPLFDRDRTGEIPTEQFDPYLRPVPDPATDSGSVAGDVSGLQWTKGNGRKSPFGPRPDFGPSA